ncbi:Microsomal dipeptidase [Cystobacter fuscus]|uniref:Microsomal dipeptidase n=1 Tax=Cystobacter fuscus TaxID=43 RepID=A0A250J2H8_9BACT|nr:dipeptidase [Cystobacter fuscus]ATB37730.1 Microsomal dipeptidase [Cystobacter fuscus]
MKTPLPLLGLVLLTAASCSHAPLTRQGPPPADAAERGRELAHRLIIVDGHIDVPYRLQEKLGPEGEPTEDISQRTAGGDFDYPRAVEGGLDVPFMSIYIPAELQKTAGASKALADSLIDLVEKLARASPDKFALARSVDEARRNTREGKVSFAMGIENGSALEDSVANVAHFHERGVRYITLTHSADNLLGDSSYAEGAHRWSGLSPLGKQVVAEMNRVGIMVDVSHLSDATIRQVLETSQQPVIASHSSCRHFTPGFERNLSDELIRAIAAKGGVVMISFGSGFLLQAAQDHEKRLRAEALAFIQQRGLTRENPEVKAFITTWLSEHPFPRARVEDVADHIEHVVKLVGIDHVGLGSDFDGVGPTLPVGLEDVSRYPNLFRVLLERGYGEAELEKLASGNVFRVWRQVEAAARP